MLGLVILAVLTKKKSSTGLSSKSKFLLPWLQMTGGHELTSDKVLDVGLTVEFTLSFQGTHHYIM